MSKPLKVFLTMLSYTAICFLGCFIYGISQQDPYAGNILPPDAFSYKVIESIILYEKFLPSIFATSMLISLSWAFSTKSIDMKRFSKIQLSNLKKVLITGFISVFFCFTFSELVVPLAKNKKTEFENNAHNYVEFYYYANKYREEKNFELANFYIENALKIFPTSQNALRLSKNIEYESVSVPAEEYVPVEQVAKYVAHYDFNPQNTAEEISYLLETSKNHYKNGDFFNAHYYAMQVQHLSKDGSLNNQEARNIAADSWNKISSTDNKYDETLAELYAEKKRGYIALVEEDYISAYYIFSGLIQKNFEDNDILFYKDVAERGMQDSVFFTDETEVLTSFESFRDIYFTVQNSDNSKDVIYIRGITILENAGQFVQYFRDFYVYTYKFDGTLLKSVYTPYAKMIAIPASSLGDSLNKQKIKQDGYVPYILLRSVDRYSSNAQILPEYTFEDLCKDKSEKNYIILEMPYEDFNLIRQASKGQDQMPIPSLLKFAEKAAGYGYSSAIFSCTLARRLSYPLFLLICFILVGLFAWNYRLMPGRKVAFRWIFVFPLINILVFLILHVLNYFGNIFFFTLYGSVGTTAIFLAPIILVVIFFISCILFLSLRGE